MKKLVLKFNKATDKGQSVALLGLRLILAYGFYETAKVKWEDINSVAEWFGSIGIPAPKLNAYLAATTEMAGVFLLTLGLGVRFISIPLIITMLVAIKTAHWDNGFAASDNGYEIPLYYLLMLLALTTYGGGKLSADFLIEKFAKK
ncbi:MAG: DoxX family protein [Bacteroidota bacterium]|nr:DoxX family protein [Bacteroidota bacterium]